MEKWMPVLSESRLFHGLTSEQLGTLLPCLQAVLRSFKKGDLLCLAGAVQTTIGLILSGQVLIQKEDGSGHRLIIGFFGPGELFGEVAAFAGTGCWPNTVLAEESGQALFIPFAKMSQPCCTACDAHQIMLRNMLGILADKAMGLNRQIGLMKHRGMREKLAAWLNEQYQLNGSRTFQTVMNREALADYLNVSRPSMSRELSRMKQDGLIDFYKSSFTVIDPQRLILILQREGH